MKAYSPQTSHSQPPLPNPHDQQNLPPAENIVKPVTVVGVGSYHGDDQVGWQVIDLLSENPQIQNSDVCLHKAAVPHDLLDWMDSTTPLHIIDACTESLPGVQHLDLSQVFQNTSPEKQTDSVAARFASLRSHSSHQLDLLSVLQIAAALGILSERIELWTIAIESADHHARLSGATRQLAADCARRIHLELTQNHA